MDNTEQVLEAGQAPNPTPIEEILETRTPAEVEAAFLKQATEQAEAAAKNRNPVDIAAMSYQLFYPRFEQMLSSLSKKELRHVLKSLIGRVHESTPTTPTFRNKTTGDVYKMGIELMQCQFMMISYMEMERMQEKIDADTAEAKALADAAPMIMDYNPEGNTNDKID